MRYPGVGPGVGSENCCVDPISAAQMFCDDTSASPCILGGEFRKKILHDTVSVAVSLPWN